MSTPVSTATPNQSGRRALRFQDWMMSALVCGTLTATALVGLEAEPAVAGPNPEPSNRAGRPEPKREAVRDSLPQILLDLLHENAHRVLQVGSLRGPDALGLVKAVALDRQGRILVLDSRNYELILYSPDGSILDRAGGSGRGPGEFVAPEDLVVTPRGAVAVADRNRTVSVYEVLSDTLTYRHRFRVNVTPEDICGLPDRIVVQGTSHRADDVLHVYALDGTALRSFGTAYSSPNLIVRETFSWGFAACLPNRGSIVSATRYRGHVSVYDTGGALQWEDTVPGFRGATVELPDRPGGMGDFDWVSPEGRHHVIDIHRSADEESLIIQAGRRDTGSTDQWDVEAIKTVVYDTDSGAVRLNTRDLPMLGDLHQIRIVTRQQLPYPSFSVFELKDGTE